MVPVLLLVLFGMIDYGLFFSNSLSLKQGTREAARQGATVTRLTDAGKQAFRNAARPVYDQWAALIGGDLVRRAEAAVEAAR